MSSDKNVSVVKNPETKCTYKDHNNVQCSLPASLQGGDYCRFHSARRAQNAQLDIQKELASLNHCVPNSLILKLNQNIDPRVQRLLIVNDHMPEQRTKEWYEYRSQIMTASPAAAYVFITDYEYQLFKKGIICLNGKGGKVLERHINTRRCNCFNSWPEQVQLKCLPSHLQKPWEGNKYTRHGVKYETIIKLIYEQHYGVSVLELGIMPHKTIDWLGASPDGIRVDGKMIEIKALSRKYTTSATILQYWIQMQLQMEVCDLDECDFVESRIVEYPSKEAYLQDKYYNTEGEFEYYLCAEELPKGIIIVIEKDYDDYDRIKREFIYAPVLQFESQEEEEEWIGQWIAEKAREGVAIFFDHSIRFKVSYYKVEMFVVHNIKRDREWFKLRKPDFEKAWNTILEYRKNGIPPELMPKKKAVQASPESNGNDSGYWFANSDDESDDGKKIASTPKPKPKPSKPSIPILDLSTSANNRKMQNEQDYETDVF